MNPLNPQVVGPILEVLPVAFAFSAQLLLAEKSSANAASALFAGMLEAPLTAKTITPIQTFTPDLGWSHYGINE
jgi:hypothetical protein